MNLCPTREKSEFPRGTHTPGGRDCNETEYQFLLNTHASVCPEYELSTQDKIVQAVGFYNCAVSKNLVYRGNRYLCPCTWYPF